MPDKKTNKKPRVNFLDKRFTRGYDGPEICAPIETLVRATPNAIVYLDKEGNVQYAFNGRPPKQFSGVLNCLAMNESIPINCFMTEEQTKQFRYLNSEGIARILCEHSVEEPYGILDEAENYADERGKETARRWLISFAGAIASVVAAMGVFSWVIRNPLSLFLGVNGFQLLMGVCAGMIGAYASIVTRSITINVQPAAGRQLYNLEAASRIAVGGIGALLIALCVKTQLILPQINGDNFKVVLLVCLVAGLSERLVPGLIKKVESGTLGDNSQSD